MLLVDALLWRHHQVHSYSRAPRPRHAHAAAMIDAEGAGNLFVKAVRVHRISSTIG